VEVTAVVHGAADVAFAAPTVEATRVVVSRMTTPKLLPDKCLKRPWLNGRFGIGVGQALMKDRAKSTSIYMNSIARELVRRGASHKARSKNCVSDNMILSVHI
jgi:hypothetical protein